MSFSAAPTAAAFKQAGKERDEPSNDPSFGWCPILKPSWELRRSTKPYETLFHAHFVWLRGSFLLRERQHEIKPGHYPVLNGVEIVTKLVQNLIWVPLFARG